MNLLRKLTTSFVVSSLILFGATFSHGYTTISDTFTIDFNTSGSGEVPYTGNYAGNNEYSYNIVIDPNTSATFTVNATSITGDPQMQIVMFDPTGSSYWAASELVDLVEGANSISWGPFDASVQLRYMIKVDADDAVTFDSFVAADGDGGTGDNSGGSGDSSSSGSGISISDSFTIDFDNGVTGTTDVAYSGTHEGENQFNYSMNVDSGGSVTFTVNATSVTGDPRMQILMFNPDNNSEYWAASDPADIVSGTNTLNWGPFDANVHLKFTILIDSDDAVTIDSFDVSSDTSGGGGSASGSISITDAVSIDFNNGVTGTTDVEYTGHHADENQYAYSITVDSGSSVTFSLNATSVTGDPRMQILMFNPDNTSEYWAASDSTDIVSGNNTVNWGPFDASVHLKFTILLDSDDAVSFDTYNVTDSGDSSSTGPTVNNGIRFRFEEVSGGTAAYSFETDAVEVSGNTAQTYSITIPAYSDPAATFEAIVLKAIGENQSIAVNDVTLTVDGTTYGGSGEDSLVFDVAFGGVSYDSNGTDGNIYTYLSTAESWGGFLQDQAQATAILPANGLVFENSATITFSANLVDTAVNLPPLYDGETAFSNGSIDTSEDTGSGRDDDAPYRWSAYVSWFTLEAGDTQGTWLGGDNWDRLSNLPATWDNGVITLAPNTASYETWSEEGSNDGIHFLEQTLKIEGTRATSAVLGNTVNFSGTVDSNTLDSRYTVTAFIKALDPNNNYTPIIEESVVLSSNGDFAISADLPAGDYSPQLGFLLTGRNANPDTDWGNIQISNVSASYGGTSSIPNGNFTNGSNGYWAAVSGVEFNTAGGNGSVPGQVVMTNTGTSRNSVYITANNNQASSLSDFGLEAGTTYDVTYYMNRISGSDLGLVQFAFNVDGTYVFVPSDTTGTIHDDSATVNGSWAQYTQTIEVPENASEAYLYVVSGAQSVIAFDQINATAQAATNDYANWASSNGLTGSEAAFDADPDGDGIPNGLESFLGTAPGTRSGGMSNIVKTSNGISMQHSHNSDLSTDISASYEWSTDLSTWNASGASVDGTTVTIGSEASGGTTTATATVSGTEPDNVFIKVSVSNE